MTDPLDPGGSVNKVIGVFAGIGMLITLGGGVFLLICVGIALIASAITGEPTHVFFWWPWQ